MPDYEVIDEYGIDYRPAGGGAPVHAVKGDTVLEADLTVTARDFLLRNNSIVEKQLLEQQAMSRDDLDAAARAAGVPDPEGLPNKQSVIDAIQTVKEGSHA